ncbi:hypothetical protein [Oscillibacter valericigenes]|nr:hypothetical protein [Oscillibacter valericigenes]MBM6909761.1 hypothetical protein [Oscillibacter valericigenes]
MATLFAVAFWTIIAGIAGLALSPAIGIICAIGVAAGFICWTVQGRKK